MRESEKEKIAYWREEGLGYRAIAIKLGISLNTVRSHCQRNGLTGTAEKKVSTHCRYCGQRLPPPKVGRKRRFCSDTCRNQWWKEHPQLVTRSAYYAKICLHCGKSFLVYGHQDQKYCSHSCFISHRFPGSKPVK